MITHPTRRAVLNGLAALPAVAIPSIAAATSCVGTEGDTPMNMHSTITPAVELADWNAAMVRYEAALAASDDYDARVFNPARRELKRRAPRPDLTLRVPLAVGGTYTEHLIPGFLDSDCERGRFGGAVLPFRDAWRAHEKAKEQAEKEMGFDAIEARHEELVEEIAEAHTALLLMPAPDLSALHWKLRETIEPGENGGTTQWCDEIRLAIVADYERLLPSGYAHAAGLV